DPRNALIIEADLGMANYRGDKVPEIQKRIVEEVRAIPGVTSVGLIDDPPMALSPNLTSVFTVEQTDLKPANAAASAFIFRVSPDYFRAAGTALIAGRSFTSYDDKNGPRVAVINQEFARSLLKTRESSAEALGRQFKLLDGTRVEVA